MASGWTNRGRFWLLSQQFRNATEPTNLFVALVKSTPTVDTNLMSDLTEVAAGNGYTSGGISLTRNSTDFDVLTEDDALDKALVQLKDLVWTATGGPLPSDSVGATYAVLTDDNATVASREVYAFWDLGGAKVVSSGQTLTVQNAQLDLTT